MHKKDSIDENKINLTFTHRLRHLEQKVAGKVRHGAQDTLTDNPYSNNEATRADF